MGHIVGAQKILTKFLQIFYMDTILNTYNRFMKGYGWML